MKTLFLVKKRSLYINEHDYYSNTPTSGLFNSSNFINQMLLLNGVHSTIREVVDANSIDKIVHHLRPNMVFIEAIWVKPEKMAELKLRHPKIQWVIRLHSNTPFIANEGMAMDWCLQYLQLGVTLAPNCKKLFKELNAITDNLVYLPNYYEFPERYDKTSEENILNVACFGAIRPLKNQLLQAFAAIKLADKKEMKLNFHINSSRVENNGSNVLKNLIGLFSNLNSNYNLIQHEWLERDSFLKLVSTMDIGMQVSFSETFNIVAADYISQNVPIVVSDEIEWANAYSIAEPTDLDDIVCTMSRVLNFKFITKSNRSNLHSWNKKSQKIWLDFAQKKGGN